MQPKYRWTLNDHNVEGCGTEPTLSAQFLLISNAKDSSEFWSGLKFCCDVKGDVCGWCETAGSVPKTSP